MTIKIGEGCGGGCELNHTPPGANNKDPNAIYFKGNNENEIKVEKQMYAALYNSKTLKDQETFNAIV